MVQRDSLGDVLKQGGFTGAGWGDDQPSLTTTDGSEHVDHARGEAIFIGLKLDAFVRVDGFQFLEQRQVTHGLWNTIIDFSDLRHLGSALGFAGLAFDKHALA